MSNLNKDGLKKIYLFNSADYQFAEIDLSDNTLLLGESAVGKTTLMRAILFFYTMNHDASALNINTESKKSFVQWYFKHLNSHIVYEYHKEGSTFLFIVSNIGRLHYTFVDLSNCEISVVDLLLEGDMPVMIEKLNERIEENRLPNYRTSSKEKYIQTFHRFNEGRKRIKQESKVDFSLFDKTTARDEFAKTLSNIFSTSKVSSDSIKKTIVSLVDDADASINLKEIKNALSEYMDDRAQIKRFEKQIPHVFELSKSITAYKEDKKSFKEQANQIDALKKKSSIKLLEIEEEIVRLNRQKDTLGKEYQPKIDALTKNIETKDKQVTIEEDRITELERKAKEYQEKDIETFVQEYKNKDLYQKKSTEYEDKYEALTSNATEIEYRYKKIFQMLKNNKDNEVISYKKGILEQKKKIVAKTKDLNDKSTKNMLDAVSAPTLKKKELSIKFKQKEEDFNETKRLQVRAENFPYNSEKIKQFSDECEKFKKALLEYSKELGSLDDSLGSIEIKIGKVASDLAKVQENTRNEFSKKKNKWQEEITSIENKLDFDKDNLYGYIYKNNLQNSQKILTYLKDEILFSEKKFTVKKQKNNVDSIFGLNVDFKEDFDFDYDQVELLDKLELLKNKIKKSDKELRETLSNSEQKATEHTRKLESERSVIKKQQREVNGHQEITKSNRNVSEENLKSAKRDASSQKHKEEERLNEQYVRQKKKLEELTAEIVSLKSEIEEIRDKIVARRQVDVDKLDVELKELDSTETKEVGKIKKEYEDDVIHTQGELASALEEKGVDKKLLQEISDKKEDYAKKLKDIETNSSYVVVYLEEYEENIKSIPVRNMKLSDDKILLESMRKDLLSLETEAKDKKSVFTVRIEKIEEVRGSIDSFITKYEDKISKQPLEEIIHSTRSLTNTMSIDDLLLDKEFLSTAIDKIFVNYGSLENQSQKVINQTQRVTKGLIKSNIFKLEIIDDYIEASDNVSTYLPIAEGLIDYVEKDKMGVLKDETSQKYKHYLNSIEKNLELFENSLMDIKTIVTKLRNKVKNAVESFNVIDSILIDYDSNSDNYMLERLQSVTTFYSENSEKFLGGLFPQEASGDAQELLSEKIEELVSLLDSSKEKLLLEEGFILKFKVVENSNDLRWRQTLNDIGSNGTSTLVKAIINISILQMVNKNSRLLNHCILDEIGTISTDYFRELKEYVNSSGFLFVNGMPIEDDILISMYSTVYVGQKYKNHSRMLLASKKII